VFSNSLIGLPCPKPHRRQAVNDTSICLRDSSEVLQERPATGLTVRDVAQRYRVGKDKIRAWIRRGELRAINTAASACARPRFIILREDLAAFENIRTGGPPPKPPRRRRRQEAVDYYPDGDAPK
jgi:Helix-turn-helix domain